MDFTSPIVPQQSFSEITVSFDVLQSISPCNFLVFELCHDSLMWASFNTRGKTLFLEEDPTWVQTVLKDAPDLNAAVVKYRTKLSEADEIMNTYRSEPGEDGGDLFGDGDGEEQENIRCDTCGFARC
ncbi:hypothetical protein L6452_22281 [Arctium lappa]|uniref:Uncharacterized protein n=1 Tax=Arctium lappa TaxID=4217 RepID=A0ACB9AZQ4_ARCLA|nr:hypothetical protein L6452_22281 [Arctium lappa]